MRRFLLIAICSFPVLARASVTLVGGSYVVQGDFRDPDLGRPDIVVAAGTFSANQEIIGSTFLYNGLQTRYRASLFGGYFLYREVNFGGTWRFNVAHGKVFGNLVGGMGSLQLVQPPIETQSFSWSFGPEWAGTSVEVRATNGQTLGSWAVPSNLSSNFVLSASIATNASLLAGAQVFLDGWSASVLAAASTNSSLNGFADRPGYALSFDGSYSGTPWEIRRQDGSVAASGTSQGILSQIIEGRVTIAELQGASVWLNAGNATEVPGGWYQTSITLSGNSITYNSFVNNPYQAQPAPMPTPGALPGNTTNSPVPLVTNAPAPVVTQPTNAEGVVSVDVGSVELGSNNDGETNVLATVGEMQTLVRGIVTDVGQAQDNLVQAVSELNGLRLNGVGRNCTFQFGPASINIQTSGAIRQGLTLLIIGMGAFAAAAMIRGAVQ